MSFVKFKGHNSGIIKEIITKFELDLCIVVKKKKNLCKNLKNKHDHRKLKFEHGNQKFAFVNFTVIRIL